MTICQKRKCILTGRSSGISASSSLAGSCCCIRAAFQQTACRWIGRPVWDTLVPHSYLTVGDMSGRPLRDCTPGHTWRGVDTKEQSNIKCKYMLIYPYLSWQGHAFPSKKIILLSNSRRAGQICHSFIPKSFYVPHQSLTFVQILVH